MSEIKTYKCDVCKKAKGSAEVATLRLQILRHPYNKALGSNQHICTDCSGKLGMVLPEQKPEVPMNEQLCDYLAEFIEAVVEEM